MRAPFDYLFRHALLRDAAYQLQLPGDRARLHALAFAALEALAGGRAPEPPPLESGRDDYREHSSDRFARELAGHARLARPPDAAAGPELDEMRASQKLYLRRAAEHAERHFLNDESRDLWQQFAALLEGAARGESLRRAAAVANRAGEPRVAEALFSQALEVFREAGCRRLEGIALGDLAIVNRVTGRVGPAGRCYEQALAISRELHDRHLEGVTLSNLGALFRAGGRIEEAASVLEQALAIHRERGDRHFEGLTLLNLGGLHLGEDQRVRAEEEYKQALVLYRALGDRRFEGVALGELATLYVDTGRLDKAALAFEEALSLHRETGHRRALGAHLCNRSLLFIALRQIDNARASWTQGSAILVEIGDTPELENRRSEMRRACSDAGLPTLEEVSA